MKKYFFEFKNRFILTMFFFVFNFIFFYLYKEFLLFLTIKITCYNPTTFSFFDSSYYFIFTNVTEIFSAYFNITTYFNLQFSVFFTLFQIFFFFGPAFFKWEYLKLLSFLKISICFFIFSLIFSYFFTIPVTWNFFLGFQDSLIQNYKKNFYFEVKLLEYLNFCTNIYTYSFLYSQMLAAACYISYQNLNILQIKKHRKTFYYVLITFIVFIGSPDLFLNQLLSCFFLFLFFEIITFLNILKQIKTD